MSQKENPTIQESVKGTTVVPCMQGMAQDISRIGTIKIMNSAMRCTCKYQAKKLGTEIRELHIKQNV